MNALRHNTSLNRRNRAAFQLVEVNGDPAFVAGSQAIIVRARDAIRVSSRETLAQDGGVPRLQVGVVQARHKA